VLVVVAHQFPLLRWQATAVYATLCVAHVPYGAALREYVFTGTSRAALMRAQIMRRARRIVNEMEFRMLRKVKSLSPSARADAMKGFSQMSWPAMGIAISDMHRLQASFQRAHAVSSRQTF
jgi:hypothetical protein